VTTNGRREDLSTVMQSAYVFEAKDNERQQCGHGPAWFTETELKLIDSGGMVLAIGHDQPPGKGFLVDRVLRWVL
jgi:hypothetical protein